MHHFSNHRTDRYLQKRSPLVERAVCVCSLMSPLWGMIWAVSAFMLWLLLKNASPAFSRLRRKLFRDASYAHKKELNTTMPVPVGGDSECTIHAAPAASTTTTTSDPRKSGGADSV